MHLTNVIGTLFLIILPFLSCDKNRELFPLQCDCDIEAQHVSTPSLVTYKVSAYDDASVSSITYQTDKGEMTVQPDSFPFTANVQLDKGDRIALTAKGNPRGGSIILAYEVQEKNAPSPLSSSNAKVWILKDGTCQ